MGRGRAFSAFQAKTLRAALRGSPVITLQVAGALDVLLAHGTFSVSE